MNQKILQERLVNFSVAVVDFTRNLPPSFVSSHLSKQIIRSATSSALNYGEATSAESKADFIHKLRLVLKELKESFVCLKIIAKCESLEAATFSSLHHETNELISIFVATINSLNNKH